MKEPSSVELTQKERALLDGARDWVSPSPADASRVKGKLWAALALGQMPSANTEPSLPKAHGLAFKQGAGLLALGLGVGLAAGYGVGHQVNRPPPVRSSEVSAVILQQSHEDPGRALGATPSETAAAQAASVVDVAGSEARPPQHRDAGTRRLGVPPGRHSATPEIDEVEWVRRVQRALAKGESQLALALLRDLDDALPSGRLLEERRAADVIAHCQISPDRGPERVAAFARDFARSVHLARIRAACGLESLDQ